MEKVFSFRECNIGSKEIFYKLGGYISYPLAYSLETLILDTRVLEEMISLSGNRNLKVCNDGFTKIQKDSFNINNSNTVKKIKININKAHIYNENIYSEKYLENINYINNAIILKNNKTKLKFYNTNKTVLSNFKNNININKNIKCLLNYSNNFANLPLEIINVKSSFIKTYKNNYNLLFKKYNHNGISYYDTVSLKTEYSKSFIHDLKFVFHSFSNEVLLNKYKNLISNRNALHYKANYIFSHLNNKNIIYNYNEKSASINNIIVNIYNEKINISINDLIINLYNDNLIKLNRNIISSNYNIFNYISISPSDNHINISNSFLSNVYMPDNVLEMYNKSVWSSDIRKSLYNDTLNSISVLVKHRRININEYYISSIVDKNCRKIFVNESNLFSLYLPKKINAYRTFMYVFNKPRPIFIEYKNNNVSRFKYKVTIENNNLFLNYYNKPIFKIENLEICKYKKPIYMDNNVYIDKLSKDIYLTNYINISQYGKKINKLSNVFISKSESDVFLNNNISIKNCPNAIFTIDYNPFINTRYKKIMFDNNKIVKNDNKSTFKNEHIMLDSESKSTFKNEYITLDSASKIIDSNENYMVSRPDTGIYSLEYINAYKFSTDANIDNKSGFVYKNHKDTRLDIRSISVYSNGEVVPDLRRGNKVDELILPKNDYDYSKHLSKLFNEDGTLNFEYVSSYNDDTGEFTVKLPFDHPIKQYANIAVDYLDLDVNAIEVFIYIIKDIWKNNMFSLINVPANEALNKIMEEAIRVIDSTYTADKLRVKEMYRCIRLFRWYSETAILNNCDYLLKYDTKQVEVDYLNKDFKEISEIVKINNLHISDDYVIEPIDKSIESTIEFTNVNKFISKPIEVCFKLYCINQSSKMHIYNDDGKCETIIYEDGMHNIEIKIKNTSTLYIEPTNNGSVYISSLSVNNYCLKTFSAHYKGNFGESNKVMDELIDKLLITGDVTEEFKESLGDVYTTSVPIDKLIDYFEIHHTDKHKGRRLITKK